MSEIITVTSFSGKDFDNRISTYLNNGWQISSTQAVSVKGRELSVRYVAILVKDLGNK